MKALIYGHLEDEEDLKRRTIVKALSGGVLPVSGVLADDEVETFCKNFSFTCPSILFYI